MARIHVQNEAAALLPGATCSGRNVSTAHICLRALNMSSGMFFCRRKLIHRKNFHATTTVCQIPSQAAVETLNKVY